MYMSAISNYFSKVIKFIKNVISAIIFKMHLTYSHALRRWKSVRVIKVHSARNVKRANITLPRLVENFQ